MGPFEGGFRALEESLGYHFRDPGLLETALVHRSYLNENPTSLLSSNERLEFLGDAVLDFLTGEFLFRRHPHLDEGELTQLRAALVRQEALAVLADRLELGKYLLMSRGEERTGGRGREAILCAAFEALIGALYLDGRLDAAQRFLLPLMEKEAARTLREEGHRNSKSLLQELTQGQRGLTPTYRIIEESGPDHTKTFHAQVLLDSDIWGQGQGPTKQAAEQAAAQMALQRLKEGPPGPMASTPE